MGKAGFSSKTTWQNQGFPPKTLSNLRFPPKPQAKTKTFLPEKHQPQGGKASSHSHRSPAQLLGGPSGAAGVHPLLQLCHGALALRHLLGVGPGGDTAALGPAVAVTSRGESSAAGPAGRGVRPPVGLHRPLGTGRSPRPLGVRTARLRGRLLPTQAVGFGQRILLGVRPLRRFPLRLLGAAAVALAAGLGVGLSLGVLTVGDVAVVLGMVVVVVFAGGDVLRVRLLVPAGAETPRRGQRCPGTTEGSPMSQHHRGVTDTWWCPRGGTTEGSHVPCGALGVASQRGHMCPGGALGVVPQRGHQCPGVTNALVAPLGWHHRGVTDTQRCPWGGQGQCLWRQRSLPSLCPGRMSLEWAVISSSQPSPGERTLR